MDWPDNMKLSESVIIKSLLQVFIARLVAKRGIIPILPPETSSSSKASLADAIQFSQRKFNTHKTP